VQPHGHTARVCILQHALEREEATAADNRSVDFFIPVPTIHAGVRVKDCGKQVVHPVSSSALGGGFRSHWPLQRGGIDWQLPQTLATPRKDRVRERGNDRRSSRLANPTWRFRTLDDVHLHNGCLIHPQHLVVIEIGLLDTAALFSVISP
jgi:hypothetical protein